MSKSRAVVGGVQRRLRSAGGESALIALLRGINVGGNKKVPMSELRELATGIGCHRVESYIQSGNLVFSTSIAPNALEIALEQSIRQTFGFSVDVVVRTGADWRGYAARTPFADAQKERPSRVLLGLSKRPPKPGAEIMLREVAKSGERIEIVEDAIWIDFLDGIGSSKLTPAVIDRAVGSSVTARNWSTVQKLDEMARALA
jgi:uncharacterized protein (DUF1697 family)